MAEQFDAAARLVEGQPAIGNVQTLVWACHLLGYQNPDLTLHASQVRDWYAGEDGLNLRALDADRVALDRAAEATVEALARQDEQLAALTAAWQGHGADASQAFLRRHSDATSIAAAAVRTAADALATLRDDLWRAVDGKVAAVMAIDDRTQAQRGEWLAAAQTLVTGAGDRAAASELIDREVKPFVDNDIRSEWLTAMRSATASAVDAYDAATAEVTAKTDAVFDVPDGLGPSWLPPLRDDDVATTPAAASAPAPTVSASPAWSAPPAWSPPAAPPMAVASPSPDPLPAASAPAIESAPAAPAPAMPSAPSLGGLPDIGGGLSGFGQQLADMLGGLIGSSEGELGDPADVEPAELDEPAVDEEPEDALDDETPDDTAEADENSDVCETPPPEPPADVPVEPPPPPPVEPAPTAVPDPPAAPPVPPEPAAATGTPCEIAADELPQVGQ